MEIIIIYHIIYVTIDVRVREMIVKLEHGFPYS